MRRAGSNAADEGSSLVGPGAYAGEEHGMLSKVFLGCVLLLILVSCQAAEEPHRPTGSSAPHAKSATPGRLTPEGWGDTKPG